MLEGLNDAAAGHPWKDKLEEDADLVEGEAGIQAGQGEAEQHVEGVGRHGHRRLVVRVDEPVTK